MTFLDSENQTSEQKPLWTLRFLIVSLVFSFLIIVLANFDGTLGIPHQVIMTILPLLILGTILSSLIGFISGFVERKKSKKRALIGILGNLLILVLLITTIAYTLFAVSHIHMIG